MAAFKLSVVVAPPEAEFEAVVRIPLEEAAPLVARYEFDGIEISLLDPKSYTASKIESILSPYGLEVPAFSTGLNFIHLGYSLTSPNRELREKAVERLKEFVDLAEPLGAGVIVGLMRGRTSKGQSVEEAISLLVEGLRTVCEHAEGKGVDVYLEPINRYETDLINTVEEALRVLDRVDSPALKLLLDTFHMNIEEPMIEESIKAAKGRIGHFHVADSNRLAPGMGHIDFKSVLAALKEAGYRGYLSAEVIIKPSLEEVLKTTRATLKPIIEELEP